MPAPRPSQSAEAARDAALQAEFNAKKWVWVPDERDGYVAAWIVREDAADDWGDVVVAANNESRRVALGSLSKMNPPKFDRVDDIADLTFLNEASVVHNLRLRYGSGAIYTYSGLFLVAINPYTQLPLYGDNVVAQYRGKRREENAPHIFAVAERAWLAMAEERENQSILITGESGAGKTENTKKVIQYLAAIATDTASHSRTGSTISPSGSTRSIASSGPPTIALPGLPRSTSLRTKGGSGIAGSATAKGPLGLLERQILQANPILEAFGNAQTQRNNNSSRFGKFVRIAFASDGSIAGANMDWYLLEKSRVVARSPAERSFHVFYQLLAGGGALRDSLLLEGGPADYEYLNKSRTEIDGVDDKAEWALLNTALDIVGFTPAEQFDLFRVIAAILHIGQIAISADRADQASIRAPATLHAEKACHLLGVPLAEFTRSVLRPRVLAGREWVTAARTRAQAVDELATLCKTLYEKAFGSLVERVNTALDRQGTRGTHFIGVLDIAGFEIFQTNGFEQLCINYTNERLQQFFNQHMFVLEQEEYAREGIRWEWTNFGMDLQPTIDLIEGGIAGIGVLSVLDEECIMPKATDATFTDKLHALWAGDEPAPLPGANADATLASASARTKYAPARFEQGFVVQHYAGRVEYRTDGWLEKNKDPLNEDLARVLALSSERAIAALFADLSDTPGFGAGTQGRRKVLRKGAFRTVGQRHKEQLASLLAQLHATQPHFVRCIVPNNLKRPGKTDVPLILDQLRCNGVLEGIRIARRGYPNRLPFAEFRVRYAPLCPAADGAGRGYVDGRTAAARMLAALELDPARFQLGATKVFFKAGVLAELEERRDAVLFDVFARMQAAARGWAARRQMRKILNRALAARTIQRNARLYGALRAWPWWQLYTRVRPLLAATRNDDELRRKSAELAVARERAAREETERSLLAAHAAQLEAAARTAEEALVAERARGQERDAQLARAAQREATLQDDVAELKSDLDTVDSQLEGMQAAYADAKAKYDALKQAFDVASEHLVRLEREEQEWSAQAMFVEEERRVAAENIAGLELERGRLEEEAEGLKRILGEKEVDRARAKERMDAAIADLEARLASEATHRDLGQSKSDALEREARQAKEELAELARTATEYTAMLQRKEAEVARMGAELAGVRRERETARAQAAELHAQMDTLARELDAQRADRSRDAEQRTRIQHELDQLRAAVASEDGARAEVAARTEKELADLRAEAAVAQERVGKAETAAREAQERARVELEAVLRQRDEGQEALGRVSQEHEAGLVRVRAAEVALALAEKGKRAAEAELQALRVRQVDVDAQLADVVKAKEMLERQLSSAHTKHQDFEDALLEYERDKGAWVRQLEAAKRDLEMETGKRAQLEKTHSLAHAETVKLKDRQIKLERELKKAQDDLHHREWDITQLRSKQDKTIVEHVHVLEEAKRLTDSQLAEAKVELRALHAQMKGLQQVKAKLAADGEDAAREAERERMAARAKDKLIRGHEEKMARAATELELERKGRETAEVQARRMDTEAKAGAAQLADMAAQLAQVQRAKAHLETELAGIATDGDLKSAMSKMRAQYESRINQLEGMVEDADTARAIAERIKLRVDREHAEIRRLLASNAPRDDTFRTRLLRELELADQEMASELAGRAARRPKDDVRVLANVSPGKRASVDANGLFGRVHKDSQDLSRTLERPDRQVNVLRQQVQVLELQMLASHRVRQHLEASLKQMTSDLDSNDGSAQALQGYRSKLARENARLAELLDDEAEARRTAEAQQMDGVKAMWTKFQASITEERESYSKLEGSRKALLAQQRTLHTELEDQRRQVQELLLAKKQCQAQLAEVTDRLEVELLAKGDETNARRKLQAQLQELEVATNASSSVQTEMQQAAEVWKAKAESYLGKLEAAEIAKAKAARAETQVRRSLDDVEKNLAESIGERKAAEALVQTLEQQVRDLEAKLEDDGREFSDMELLRTTLTEEMDEERHQHQKDLAERDFSIDQTRKKYQTELAQLSEELQFQRDAISRLREDNRKMRSEHDELQVRYDDEVYSGGSWKKDKERLEGRIADVTAAYEGATTLHAEQQSQIVTLLSQVRELRAHLDDADAERAALQQARRALESRLSGIAQEHLDTSKMSADRAVQALHLEKQDLRSALDEQTDKAVMASERLKKAETFAAECQTELGKVRSENSDLDKLNAKLEKQVKELNVRIVDFETRAYATNPRPPASRRLESRIEELQSKLSQESKEKTESARLHRTADKSVRDTKFQLAESDRSRARLEEEVREYETKVDDMRRAMDILRTSESELQLAKRRAEREAVDFKQRALSLERELERLRSRLERPSSVMIGSPISSPRKHDP